MFIFSYKQPDSEGPLPVVIATLMLMMMMVVAQRIMSFLSR